MHAVVFTVDIKPNVSQEQLDAELDHLVKHITTIPGFVRGTWTTDGTTGLSMQIYQDEQTARTIADNAMMPPDAGVIFRSAHVYEVSREA